MIWTGGQGKGEIPVSGKNDDETTGVIMFKILEERKVPGEGSWLFSLQLCPQMAEI